MFGLKQKRAALKMATAAALPGVLLLSVYQALAPAVSRGSSFIRRTGVLDISLIIGAFFLYSIVREMAGGSTRDAFAHSFDIVKLEQSLGVFQEPRIQQWVLPSEALVRFFNFVYTYGHFPLIGVVGVWLFIFHRDRYLLFRNAFFVAGAIGLLVFNIFPMAPPRLMPLPYGMEDTLSLFQRVNYHSAGAFVNPYAAMPSMHVAFNLLLCLAIASASSGMRAPWRAIGLAISVVLPIVMAMAVVVTGNHYILDVVAGYVVAAMGMGVALAVREHGWRVWRALPATA